MSEIRPTAPPPSDDWVSQLLDRLDGTIDMVRSRTTGPAINGMRGIVFGLMAAFVAVVLAVLAAITLLRLVDNFVPGPVWIAYFIVSAIFLIAGMIVYAKRGLPQP